MICIDMSCQFSIPITSSITDVNITASAAILANGGTFASSSSGGSFLIPTFIGSIGGTFALVSGSLDVTITDKPWLVSCSTIQGELVSYLTGRN